MRQLRFRFPKLKTELTGGGFVVARTDSGFAVVPIGDDGRILRQPGLGIAYAHTLESAHRTLPDGLLCIDGMEAARYGKKLPSALREVLEVWF